MDGLPAVRTGLAGLGDRMDFIPLIVLVERSCVCLLDWDGEDPVLFSLLFSLNSWWSLCEASSCTRRGSRRDVSGAAEEGGMVST